ncbi:MAG: TatD family hydrolase [Verrucomicrobia bacterium]|nr:TatD family hydrolase [Verrucomicrobiota bacterium]
MPASGAWQYPLAAMLRNLCDAHNHLQDERLAPHLPDILTALPAAGISACVVNGTSEADWPRVAALARAHPDLIIPSFGLHPWQAHQRSPDWLDLLTEQLHAFPHAGLGECGLDRWIPNHDLPEQTAVFLAQLDLATRLDRPLSIHCLQAWGPLLDLLRDHPRPRRGILLHSYGGSAEMIPLFAALGAYFSFSGYFLEPRKEATRLAFRQIPDDRLLLETDAPDMLPPENLRQHPLTSLDGKALNHPANLPAIAEGLAKLRSIDPDQLIALTTNNFHRFFR